MSRRAASLQALALLLAMGSALAQQSAPAQPQSQQEVREALGRKLFFDPVLSRDGTISCASCHRPERAFADDRPFSLGVGGAVGTRNTPTVMNSSGRTALFWDGRAETLEDQAIGPIENPVEMALPIAEAVARLNAIEDYRELFQRAYQSEATPRTIGRALAAFQKTLDTVDSPYDRYAFGDDAAMSEAARRGRLLFIGKGRCADCHAGEDFTSDRFRNIGLFDGEQLTDPGRAAITGNEADAGLFKVPTLRNVALTAPYMHNGMFSTLREVIDYYDQPDRFVPKALNRDASIVTLSLTEQEKQDLEAFLQALTDDRFTAAAVATTSAAQPGSTP